MTKDFLYDFIQQHRYGVLSSVSPDHIPQSAYVGIASTPELIIIFDTVSNSRKYTNIHYNPFVSFVIGWDHEQTIQYEGFAKIPEIEELQELLPVYFSVFPDGKYRKENWNNLVYFCVEPRWIRYSDFNGSTPTY